MRELFEPSSVPRPAAFCVSVLLALLTCAAPLRAEIRNQAVLGYDSFIDRYTILEADTFESIQELSGGLSNAFLYRRGAAKAGVNQAQASRDLAYTTIGKHSVYSPVTGLVSARLVEPGEFGSPNMAVFRLVDISSVYVEAVIGEDDIAKVTKGQEAGVTVAGLAGATLKGRAGRTRGRAGRSGPR